MPEIRLENFPQSFTPGDLIDRFQKYGHILDCKIISAGSEQTTALISFATDLEAFRVMYKVNEKPSSVAERPMRAVLLPASPKEDCDRTLFVRGMPTGHQASDLESLFRRFGTIQSVRIIESRNFSFVRFSKHEEALAAATAMHGRQLEDGSVLYVVFQKPRVDRTVDQAFAKVSSVQNRLLAFKKVDKEPVAGVDVNESKALWSCGAQSRLQRNTSVEERNLGAIPKTSSKVEEFRNLMDCLKEKLQPMYPLHFPTIARVLVKREKEVLDKILKDDNALKIEASKVFDSLIHKKKTYRI